MPSRRLSAVFVTATILLFLTTGTVAAQSVNRDLIDGLEAQLLYVALPLSLFVLIVLIYAPIKFYDNDDPKPTPEDPALEITWTAATAIILLFVGVSAYTVLVSPYISPAQPADLAGGESADELEELPETGDEEIHVRGYQWGWETTYPEADVTLRDELVMPADEDVSIWMTSDDVIHSLFIADLGTKQDIFPGEYTRMQTHAYETGEYDAVCTEFCGAGHARMDMNVVVLEPEEYDEWLEDADSGVTDGEEGTGENEEGEAENGE